MKNFWTRWAVLLISMIFLSSCGGSNSTETTALTPEGDVITPVSLTANIINPPSYIHPGQVGNTSSGSKSYYLATGLTIGDTYTISLYGLSADADLLVYNGFPFDSFPPSQPNLFSSNGACVSQNGLTANEQCTVKAQSTTMNIEVDGQYSLSGATYSISLIRINPIVSATACGGTGTCIDFESTWPTFTYSGTGTQWLIDITASNSPTHSIHSTGLTDSQNVCFSYTAATTSATNPYVTFNLRTSSTPYYDLLLFYIDNVLQTPVWSGNPASWQNVMFNTSSGTHTYKWCHTYTGGATSGDVWVDDIYLE